jgi:ABC-2 type transport system permease protein
VNGFRALVKKELVGTIRTWRIWVVPGVLLFCGVSSPITARLLPLIVRASARSSSGVIIKVPRPVPLDGYKQYIGNLAQLAALAILVAGAGLINSELKSGTGPMVLTKPISRTAFVVAKAVTLFGLVLVATVLATLACYAATAASFGSLGPLGQLLPALLVWLVFAALLVAASAYFSVVIGSQGGAAGAAVGFFVGLSALDAVPLLASYTPAGLTNVPGHLIGDKPVALLWPLLTGAAVAAVLVVAAVGRFGRKEI